MLHGVPILSAYGVQMLSAYLDYFEFRFAPRYLCLNSGHCLGMQLNLSHSVR